MSGVGSRETKMTSPALRPRRLAALEAPAHFTSSACSVPVSPSARPSRTLSLPTERTTRDLPGIAGAGDLRLVVLGVGEILERLRSNVSLTFDRADRRRASHGGGHRSQGPRAAPSARSAAGWNRASSGSTARLRRRPCCASFSAVDAFELLRPRRAPGSPCAALRHSRPSAWFSSVSRRSTTFSGSAIAARPSALSI